MRLVAILIVISATVIIQWHGIRFWSEQAGETGPAWSLALEAAALWLWWHSNRLVRLVGLLGTLVVLSGPLYVISAPVLDGAHRAQARVAEKARLERSLSRMEHQLAQYLENSRTRAGWLPAIQRTEERIRQAQARLDAIEAAPVRLRGQSIALIVIEVLALLIITVAQITAIRSLAVRVSPSERETGSQAPTRPAARADVAREPRSDKPIEKPAKRSPRLVVVGGNDEMESLRNWLKEIVEKHGGIKNAAERMGIDRREVGYALRSGGRKPKAETWERIRQAMLADDPFKQEEVGV